MKKTLLVFTSLLILFGATSCKEFWDEVLEMESDQDSEKSSPEQRKKKPPQYVLTVHEIVKYPRAEMLERQIPSFSNQPLYVNVNAFLHSRSIEKIESRPRQDNPEFFDIILHLDRLGFIQWSMFSVRFKGQPMALVVDGICYRTFVPKIPAMAAVDPEDVPHEVEIEGPFDPVTAAQLVKWSTLNYKHYHKND